jgi:hypothetical protein
MFNDFINSGFSKVVVKVVSEKLNIDKQVLAECIRPDETIDIEEVKRRTDRDIPVGVIEYFKKHNELMDNDDVSQMEYISEIESFRDEFIENHGFFLLQKDIDAIADILEETCFEDEGEQISIQYSVDNEYYFAEEGWSEKVGEYDNCIVSRTTVVVPASKVTNKSAVKQALKELREKKTEETSLIN